MSKTKQAKASAAVAVKKSAIPADLSIPAFLKVKRVPEARAALIKQAVKTGMQKINELRAKRGLPDLSSKQAKANAIKSGKKEAALRAARESKATKHSKSEMLASVTSAVPVAQSKAELRNQLSEAVAAFRKNGGNVTKAEDQVKKLTDIKSAADAEHKKALAFKSGKKAPATTRGPSKRDDMLQTIIDAMVKNPAGITNPDQMKLLGGKRLNVGVLRDGCAARGLQFSVDESGELKRYRVVASKKPAAKPVSKKK